MFDLNYEQNVENILDKLKICTRSFFFLSFKCDFNCLEEEPYRVEYIHSSVHQSNCTV